MTRAPICAMLIVACASMLVTVDAFAQATKARPIAKDHPIVGRWTYTVPDGSCQETYHFRPDGTTVVTSGEEIAETVFEISAKPDPAGFYKWTDKLVKDNGKKDCAGTITAVGKEVTNWIIFNPEGDIFLICAEASFDACFGPLYRARGQAV